MSSDSSTSGSLFGGSPLASAFLAHEVRNLVNVAILSLKVLETTGAGVMGRDGRTLRRSLGDLRTLVNRALSETRTAHLHLGRTRIDVGDFIGEIEAAARLEAQARGIRLVVPLVPDGLVIEADRHELSAAVRNLVQNAIKFTRPGSAVTVRVEPSDDRVRIDVQDECGGLGCGGRDELFVAFEQRGTDRSGLGLGLAFSRQAVEAVGGTITVRNLPGHGCVFAIDLPRAHREEARASSPRGHDGVCNATQASGDQHAMVAS